LSGRTDKPSPTSKGRMEKVEKVFDVSSIKVVVTRCYKSYHSCFESGNLKINRIAEQTTENHGKGGNIVGGSQRVKWAMMCRIYKNISQPYI
jgi:hypothetical protein